MLSKEIEVAKLRDSSSDSKGFISKYTDSTSKGNPCRSFSGDRIFEALAFFGLFLIIRSANQDFFAISSSASVKACPQPSHTGSARLQRWPHAGQSMNLGMHLSQSGIQEKQAINVLHDWQYGRYSMAGHISCIQRILKGGQKKQVTYKPPRYRT